MYLILHTSEDLKPIEDLVYKIKNLDYEDKKKFFLSFIKSDSNLSDKILNNNLECFPRYKQNIQSEINKFIIENACLDYQKEMTATLIRNINENKKYEEIKKQMEGAKGALGMDYLKDYKMREDLLSNINKKNYLVNYCIEEDTGLIYFYFFKVKDTLQKSSRDLEVIKKIEDKKKNVEDLEIHDIKLLLEAYYKIIDLTELETINLHYLKILVFLKEQNISLKNIYKFFASLFNKRPLEIKDEIILKFFNLILKLLETEIFKEKYEHTNLKIKIEEQINIVTTRDSNDDLDLTVIDEDWLYKLWTLLQHDIESICKYKKIGNNCYYVKDNINIDAIIIFNKYLFCGYDLDLALLNKDKINTKFNDDYIYKYFQDISNGTKLKAFIGIFVFFLVLFLIIKPKLYKQKIIDFYEEGLLKIKNIGIKNDKKV
jgi:hypothetical protein